MQPRASRGRRGPKPRVDFDTVLDAARELAYQDLTMAAVAARVGVSAPTLYGYVSGKEELVKALVTRLSRALEPPDPDLPWDEWVRALAELFFVAVKDNPILAGVDSWPQIAREVVDLISTGHAVLRRDGIPDEVSRVLIGGALSIAHGNAVQAVSRRRTTSAQIEANEAAVEVDTATMDTLEAIWSGVTPEKLLREQVALLIDGARTSPSS